MITIAKDGSGDYCSINEALSHIEKGPETLYIKAGTYKECVEVTIPDITFEGEDSEKTIITFGNYANMIMEDGSKRGTFRSYTCLINTHNFTARNITFENSSGFGDKVGQAIALYVEGDNNKFYNCRLLGHQDTLFTGPLPAKVKIPGGFTGPTEFAPRVNGHQYYENCFICGEIDFIFGSATAYFKNCTIYAIDKGEEVNSYLTAPSTPEGQKFGYVFDSCKLTGNCPDGTVWLGRPWRDYGKSVFIRCEIPSQIHPTGFDDWGKELAHTASFFAEYKCFGPGADRSGRVAFAHELSDEEAAEYTYENIMNS